MQVKYIYVFLKSIQPVRSYNLRSNVEWQPAQSAKVEVLYQWCDLTAQFIANTEGLSPFTTRQPRAENSYRNTGH